MPTNQKKQSKTARRIALSLGVPSLIVILVTVFDLWHTVFSLAFILIIGACLVCGLYYLISDAVENGIRNAKSKENPKFDSTSKKKDFLWCEGIGRNNEGHYISPGEPYRFLIGNSPDDGFICMDCLGRRRKHANDLIAEFEEQKRKEAEWNALSEPEREQRREIAKAKQYCPKCDKPLNPTTSTGYKEPTCPMCCEFPNNPNAPMHQVKRILEWTTLTDSEKEKREADFIAQRARNLSTWAVQDNEGVWRRKDNGSQVNLAN